MPRTKRNCPAGMIFHCLNRSVARLTLFEKDRDYEAFERILEEAFAGIPLPILDYAVMPNHWHFVVQSETDSHVSDFFQWLTVTHAVRWHAHYQHTCLCLACLLHIEKLKSVRLAREAADRRRPNAETHQHIESQTSPKRDAMATLKYRAEHYWT